MEPNNYDYSDQADAIDTLDYKLGKALKRIRELEAEISLYKRADFIKKNGA